MEKLTEHLSDPKFVAAAALMLISLFFLIRNSTEWKKTVSYTVLVQEIILFTGAILASKNIKHFPTFKICYCKHKKYMGLFHGHNSNITIYLKSHENIPTLVDTVLHEVAHYIQQKTDAQQFKRYDEYTKSVGYYDNPMEIDSRSFAKENMAACLRHLALKKQIRKKS